MATIAASAIVSCFGDGEATFEALLAGRVGARPLPVELSEQVNVAVGYTIDGGPGTRRAAYWLRRCVSRVLDELDLDAPPGAIPVLVGTGMGGLPDVERPRPDQSSSAADLHFSKSLAGLDPRLGPVITLSNACSASGHALGLAQDLVDQGRAPAVIAAGCDSMSRSMLAMIGRVATERTDRIRPFDKARTGVLLGEGAAATAVVAAHAEIVPLASLLSTGISCDATHETAPDIGGILRAMEESYARAGQPPGEIDLVIAHGTGTVLNDSTESAALARLFAAAGTRPTVTGIKGALGHTSGAAALMSVDVAIRAMRTGLVPPVIGLTHVAGDCSDLEYATGTATRQAPRRVQVDAFGFGGVNTVMLLEAA